MTKVTFLRLKENWRADNFNDAPLGLLSVIASARQVKHNGHYLDINYHDMNIDPAIPKSDVYGLSGCSLDYPELLKVASQIKSQYNGKIIAGGTHMDVFPKEYWENEIKKLPLDIICSGEGEATFPLAMSVINSQDKKVITQKGLLNIDDISMPAWDVLDKKRYFINGNGTAMSSRGCPGNCSFCASPNIYKHRVRFRGVALVEDELNYLQKNLGINYIRWQDDCFSLGKERFKKLSEMIASKGIHYRASLRTDQVNDGVFNQLKKSGCNEVGYGIESAEQKILDLLNKNNTIENNIEALIQSKERGFKTRAFIMTGLPGEDEHSAERMIGFLEGTNPDVVTLTSFTPLPGSDIYNNPSKYGVEIIDKDFAKYNMAIRFASGAPFVHKLSTVSTEGMEKNREMLKDYLFSRGKSHVSVYNEMYKQKGDIK